MHPDDIPRGDLRPETRVRLSRRAPAFAPRSGPAQGGGGGGTKAKFDDLKRAKSLLAGEKRLLEMVALGRPLHEILNSLCTFVEQTAPECQCAVFPIDPGEHRFDKGFAPSLGDAYTGPLQGVPVVPGSAPCGAAAIHKTQVIAVDIES